MAKVVDAAPDVEAQRRYGARSAANEPRPDVYRHIWQTFGSYVFPIGPRGLQADAGKFASNLGYETSRQVAVVVAEGFLLRGEYRHDASNRPFVPGSGGRTALRRTQPAALPGAV